jgi:hypothetical protein
MDTREIIIETIRQDMRCNQYLTALRKLGIVCEFEPDFVTIVLQLMNVKVCTDSWIELYVTFLNKSDDYEIIPPGDNLYPLARECYKALQEFGGNRFLREG